MSRKIAFTLTTIRSPVLIEGYLENFKTFRKDSEEVNFIVVGDLKTPENEVLKIGEKVKKAGYGFEYLNPEFQKKWLEKYSKITEYIPWNSPLRRNLGYLRALEGDSEIILSMDDDNFAGPTDFLSFHSVVGTAQAMREVSSKNGWFNPCSMLSFNYKIPVYMRGFPYYKRWTDQYSYSTGSGKVVINMGLWYDKPDVDSVTNLNLKDLKVESFLADNGNQLMLSRYTMMPINTQNTAILRECFPAFYCVPYGYIHGIYVGRYDDVWGGVLCKKIIDHMDHRITVGEPLTIHRRNIHDLLQDLKNEFWGMLLAEELYKAISNVKLRSNNYADGYIELSRGLKEEFKQYWDEDAKKFMMNMFDAMEVWANIVDPLV